MTEKPKSAASVFTKAGRSLAERIASKPVLVNPDRVAVFGSCLVDLLVDDDGRKMVAAPRAGVGAAVGYWPDSDSWEAQYKPYAVRNGVLQVPVFGALLNRFNYQAGPWATGYTYIQKAVERGMKDDQVKAIAFIIDSPGGEAAGNFELVDKLFEMRGEKPMKAFVADDAYSGGYSIASVADEVIVTRSGGTGSVGVVSMHLEVSKMLENEGYSVTFIYAGKHKVDGNSYQPLSEAARERWQGHVDKLYGVFVSTVARNRNMSEDAVRKTEALCFDSDESITVGFADRIGVFEEELAAFESEVVVIQDEEDQMTTKTQDTAVETPASDARGPVDQIEAAALTRGRAEGAKAERERFAAVMSDVNYKGREALASKMLAETDLDASAISNLLAASPETPSASAVNTPRNHFAERMDAEGSPNVGSDDSGDEEQKPDLASGLVAAHRKATGVSKAARG